jgi:hypothetical protein
MNCFPRIGFWENLFLLLFFPGTRMNEGDDWEKRATEELRGPLHEFPASLADYSE